MVVKHNVNWKEHMKIPSHTTVAAYLALAASVSTGGTYAAVQIADDSVGSAQIKPMAIRMSDLSRDVIGNITPVVTVREGTRTTTVLPHENVGFGVGCAAGEKAVGGGAIMLVHGGTESSVIRASYPSNDDTVWEITIGNTDDSDQGSTTGYAICIRSSGSTPRAIGLRR